MWEIFNGFLPLKIQINSQKTRFWKEKSVEDMVTLGPMAQVTLVNINPFITGFSFNPWEKRPAT
jgi:hypothetical protein